MNRVIAFAQAILLLACVPTVTRLEHRPDLAAKVASDFAQVAFVEHDARRAYDLLWEQGKARVQFEKSLVEMHPQGYPTEVNAVEYEPIFGQPAMNIFLHGVRGEEQYYYRIVVQGTAPTGYKVSDCLRGSGPYPPSPARKPL
jgi:hypothetical protein